MPKSFKRLSGRRRWKLGNCISLWKISSWLPSISRKKWLNISSKVITSHCRRSTASCTASECLPSTARTNKYSSNALIMIVIRQLRKAISPRWQNVALRADKNRGRYHKACLKSSSKTSIKHDQFHIRSPTIKCFIINMRNNWVVINPHTVPCWDTYPSHKQSVSTISLSWLDWLSTALTQV